MYSEITDNMKELFSEPPVLKGRTLTLRPLVLSDVEDLRRLSRQEEVYHYLPTFLFEKKYEAEDAILHLYDEGLKDSLILGIFREDCFCGLAEIYSYRARLHKVSVGYRLLKEKWGEGVATEAVGILFRELLDNRGVEIITASTMVENLASAHVLEKNDFTLVHHAFDEDWGFAEPTPAEKWIRLSSKSVFAEKSPNRVILITGASHTGKTLLAQRMLEKHGYPYLSIDHLKMGLIRSGYTDLTPEDDDALTEYLWPIVREIIKTAIENRQNLIIEGCYIPFEWRHCFDEKYLSAIRFICLAMTEEYIKTHFDEIIRSESEIESRLIEGDCTVSSLAADNAYYIEGFQRCGEKVLLIDSDYEQAIKNLLDVMNG